MALLSDRGIGFAAAVLVMSASLLLSACADSIAPSGKKQDPVVFGTAGAANGGGGAMSGMSFSW
jgi:hypothetical protein